MRRQTFRFVLHSLGAVVTAVIIAALIDHYHFSWTGYFFNKAGLCGYKTVATVADNGFPQKLSYDFEPGHIAREMRKNSNYEVNAFYNNRGAVVARRFGNINYQISFQNSRGSYEGFNLNTAADDEKYSFPSVSGEDCSTPSAKIKENVFLMIDDLPLTNGQKTEMKEHVSVRYLFGGRFW